MLNGKTAWVTGASRGLGRAIARQLAGQGCRVALIARDSEALRALAAELGESASRAFPADLADREQVLRLASEASAWAPPDVLVNNAGLGDYRGFLEHTPSEHERIIDVNLRAVVHLCHGVLPGMLERGHGHIVNIASDLACRPMANMAVYAASKFGLRGLSLSLMKEFKDRGIRVSLVNPGMIDTAFHTGEEGRLDPASALQPAQVAETVLQLLTQPGFQMVDEITLHAVHQDY
jgi:short-subunit dehydrogenase